MSTPFWITLAVTLAMSGVMVILVTELVLFARGRPPVTTVVRGMVDRHSVLALLVSHVVVLGMGFAVAHLIADR